MWGELESESEEESEEGNLVIYFVYLVKTMLNV